MLGRLKALYGGSPPDVCAIADLATVLKVSQFELFRIAHREWFGREADEKALESVFVRFLFSQSPPAWVRHFVRHASRLADRGRLDPTVFGLPPWPRETMSVTEFDRWSVAIYACVLAMIFFGVPVLAAF